MKLLERLNRPSDTVARWIALTTMAAMLTALALTWLLSQLAGVWARPPLLETGLLERLASISRIIDAAPREQRPAIARSASDETYTTTWLLTYEEAGLPPADEDVGFRTGEDYLRSQLRNPNARIEGYEPADWPSDQPGAGYALMVEMHDGSWVKFSALTRIWGLNELPRGLIIVALVLLSTIIVALIATRHLASPLERFARGARRVGSDFRAPPIAVEGPQEIRQAIVAFNAMQAQLQHFINDRTQMLAAISHDLRAPLTRMRLRGEFVEDPDQQAKLFRDVDEMQVMINSALEFFRDDARLEPATAFDIAELLHTVVDDFRDSGVEVALSGPNRLVYTGRPIGIKRMLINLLDNAIKYGREPAVALVEHVDRLEIRVLDRGPGIAPEYHEAVFKPFFRIEGSRNKHTGGVGLGLSAARATVLEHGGTLTLANRRHGGLAIRIVLPLG
ncbi:Signal transduction histidine kinase [Pseudomonas flavescens]|uniref:histidine kinase n=1 Tax=Phytopseudomonas flavescens TaxID=29435 RepID=A0A1G7ZKG0_9GAMM|nr:ATP-binding protein [Pseudomonas flavescens]SDH09232.1 Signal transduction histidine kinase [Pseudomonas flavescens]